jgi:hypothetical protein
VPSAALRTQAFPATSIPAETTLSYRDVAAAGISPSGPTELPDPDGFKTVTYRRKTSTRTPTEIAVKKIKPRRQPLIGASSSQSLPVISKPERSKTLFVSRFSSVVTADGAIEPKKVGLHQTQNYIQLVRFLSYFCNGRRIFSNK